jgi:phage virion morphogenesis protein
MALTLKAEISGLTPSRTIADLDAMGARLHDMRPAFKIAGQIARGSINRNFMEGGRPSKWAPLKPATIRRRRGFGNPQVLRDTGVLMTSIGAENDAYGIYELAPSSLTLGTNVPYAAPHQFGATSGRSHTVVVPARPFMMLQDVDVDRIAQVFEDFISKGDKKA